jgi:hypothetical protein
MSVNDSNTPAEFPNNEWTQMIEAIHHRNESGMSLTPAEIRGVPTVGTPMPSVRSPELGRPVVGQQLSSEEIEDLNRRAIESGMVVGPVNPSIASTLASNGGMDDSPYGSLEEAIAAGAPVGVDAETVSREAARYREVLPSSPTIQVRTPIGSFGARSREAQLVARHADSPSLPRLPDFKKVQMIDMVNGKVYVDGLEFSMSHEEIKQLRKFCVTKAKEQVQASLDAALKALAEDVGEEGDTGTA